MRFGVGGHLLQTVGGAGVVPLDEVEFDEGVEGIAPREVFLHGLRDVAVLVPVAQQAPEDVFVVVGDPGYQGVGEGVAAAHVPVVGVELRIVRLQQAFLLLLDIVQQAFGGILSQPEKIDGDGLAECLDFIFGLGAELVAELPVGAGTGVDVLHAGVVIVPCEVLCGGFFLDAVEDVDLVLGTVGVDSLFIVCPEFGERVVILGAGGKGKVHQGQECEC